MSGEAKNLRSLLRALFVLAGLGAGLAFPLSASAEPTLERTPVDVGIKVGVALGSYEQTSPSASGGYGGFPVAAQLNLDISTSFTLQMELGFIADLGNAQVTRQGLNAEAVYHLLGGSRRTQTDYGSVLEVTRNPYNLSVLLRPGFQHYSGSNGDNATPTFQGSVFELAGGVQYRYDLNDTLALDIEIYTTLYNIPASSERLKVHLTEYVVSLRFFL